MTQTSNIELRRIGILGSNCVCRHAFIFALNQSNNHDDDEVNNEEDEEDNEDEDDEEDDKDLVSFFSCLNAQGSCKAKHW